VVAEDRQLEVVVVEDRQLEEVVGKVFLANIQKTGRMPLRKQRY